MQDFPDETLGNKTKGKTKKATPAYLTNTVTMSDRKNCETPIIDDDNVEYARKFSEENKK